MDFELTPMRFLFFIILSFFYFSASAQYTELINTNRPGASQGAFSVGRDVLQLEGGLYYGEEQHKITELEMKAYGLQYEVRYGIFVEQLELNLSGDFLNSDQAYLYGNTRISSSLRNFKHNAVGVKYLLYDPNKRRMREGPNLYSWRANHTFQWWWLVPAVSVYAGTNITFGNRPAGYPFFGEQINPITSRVVLITQHNWGGTAFVTNFEFDRLETDHKRYSGIFTLTQTLGQRISFFAEYQFIKDDFYSDDIFRLGGAYLFSRDFQLDAYGMHNTKDTPDRWQVGIGAAYRFDFHRVDEVLESERDRLRRQRKEAVRQEPHQQSVREPFYKRIFKRKQQ